MVWPSSPSLMRSTPTSFWWRTTSATALLSSFSKAASSNVSPRVRFWLNSRSFGGRGRLPTWVVRIRLAIFFLPALHEHRGGQFFRLLSKTAGSWFRELSHSSLPDARGLTRSRNVRLGRDPSRAAEPVIGPAVGRTRWRPSQDDGSYSAPRRYFIVGMTNSAPSLTPESQRAVTVLVLV